jgi:hypothetical protein
MQNLEKDEKFENLENLMTSLGDKRFPLYPTYLLA